VVSFDSVIPLYSARAVPLVRTRYTAFVRTSLGVYVHDVTLVRTTVTLYVQCNYMKSFTNLGVYGVPDPIVEEVRRVRREITEECNNDIHLLFERHRQQIRDRNVRVVTKSELDARRQHELSLEQGRATSP